jgi:hypothetical protein
MNSKPTMSPLLKIAVGLIVAFCALATTVFWMTDPLHIRAPSDQKLLATFHDHRAALEKLRQMAIEDSQTKWYFNAFNPADDKTHDARREEYRKLLNKISPSLEWGVGYNGAMSFNFAEGGLSTIGPEWGKGIEYAPDNSVNDEGERPNLDHTRHWPSDVYTRKIEPHWFIYYQQTD